MGGTTTSAVVTTADGKSDAMVCFLSGANIVRVDGDNGRVVPRSSAGSAQIVASPPWRRGVRAQRGQQRRLRKRRWRCSSSRSAAVTPGPPPTVLPDSERAVVPRRGGRLTPNRATRDLRPEDGFESNRPGKRPRRAPPRSRWQRRGSGRLLTALPHLPRPRRLRLHWLPGAELPTGARDDATLDRYR